MSLLFAGRRREEVPLGGPPSDTARLPDWLREIVVYGCHGGAGTSTLATLLGSPWDLGSYQQVQTQVGTYGRPLLVVCRDSVNGSSRAVDALAFLSAAGVRAAALVVVSEGTGPEPKEATMRFRMAGDSVRGVVRLPYVTGLRYVDADQAGQVGLPKKARSALAEIRRVCAAAAHSTLDELQQATLGAN